MDGLSRYLSSLDGVPSPSMEELQELALACMDCGDPRRRLMDLLDERFPFSAPSSLVDEEFQAIWRSIEADRRAGRLDPEDAGKDRHQLKQEYRAIADRRVRIGLIIAKLASSISIISGPTAEIENEVVEFIFWIGRLSDRSWPSSAVHDAR